MKTQLGDSWPSDIPRPRRLKLRFVVSALIAAVLAAVTFTPAPARRAGIQMLGLPEQICLGSILGPGVRYRVGAGGPRSYKVTIWDPQGVKVFATKGRAAKRWRSWSFTPEQTGSYRTVYRTGRVRRTFVTEVTDCSTGSPLPPAPPSPPPAPPPPEGSVDISDNDGGAAALSLSDAAPGASDTACITVTYVGTLPATVLLYGATTGTGLDQYLDLTVTRGNSAEPFDSCASFVPDGTDYIGLGPGVVYAGSLRDWPDHYAGGLIDPIAASPETWTLNESHTYRFEVRIPATATDAAQGLTAGQTFVWEARD